MNTDHKKTNPTKTALTATLLLCLSTQAQAHETAVKFRPESHAPAGVMADHLHKRGEWMVGARTQSRSYSGLYHGSDTISPIDAGYSSIATHMSMQMLMLDIMYAPSDKVTLMLMPQHMRMTMTMTPVPASMGTAHSTGPHTHEVSGIGDTLVGALIGLKKSNNRSLHATVSLSVPTGSVKEQAPNGAFTHYGMQLGSGTWDLLPSLTYTTFDGMHSWGLQAGARLPLEGKNDSGFSVGEKYSVTAWRSYRVTEYASLSARSTYEKQGRISGHYNGPHNHTSPGDFQANYGGEFIDLGLGLNFVPQEGTFAGLRTGVEWITPISEHYNGIQVGRKNGINLSLSYAL